MPPTADPPTDLATADPGDLRQRADRLVRLALEIERSPVMSLPDLVDGPAWQRCRRARMCDALLERNLHQLHIAAEHLRTMALRLRARARDVDAGAAA